MQAIEPLRFKVAPHLVEDLGLNLYTTLPKVLVEFIANSYDADSPFVNIELDKTAIENARDQLENHSDPSATLPEQLSITIEDEGHGMDRKAVQEKFLVAGRRRRRADPEGARSKGGRILMGRKGLGKLAGFGVAHSVSVVTRVKDGATALRFEMDFESLLAANDLNGAEISEHVIEDPAILPNGGTIIKLTRLLPEPMKARLSTIENEISAQFLLLDPADFAINLNGSLIPPESRIFSFAWPDTEIASEELVDKTLVIDGKPVQFKYRLRFTEDRNALPGRDRGIRVYAHRRLAAAPSLLGADTNMHGFRMTDYLDGVLYADFIDDQIEDYIATDRQGLRWDTPLLAPLYDFLSSEIKEACKARQSARDEEKEKQAKSDTYTNDLIERMNLSRRETTVFNKIAGQVASLHKQGFDDTTYKLQIGQIAGGMASGDLFASIESMSQEDHPELNRVVASLARLTANEFDGFLKFVKARLSGVRTLQRIVNAVDFKRPNNEDELHELLAKSPWLIDVTFFEFLASNRSNKTLFTLLEQQLNVGKHVLEGYDKTIPSEADEYKDNKRPDLVFLLGNTSLSRVIIIELKAPNTPLIVDHLHQLRSYMRKAREWLATRADYRNVRVEGILIGSHDDPLSRKEGVLDLRYEIERLGRDSDVSVYGIDELLNRAEIVHSELLASDEEDD